MRYLLQIPLTVPEIIFVSLLLLVLDIYPQVKSFSAMLSTVSFWLLWLAFTTLTGIAYFFLATTSLLKMQDLVGPVGSKLVIIVLAALMGWTVVQSLSLKIADVKILNLQALLDDYRRQVLEDITRQNSTMQRRQAFQLSDRLFEQFGQEDLREEYCQLLLVAAPESAEKLSQQVVEDAAKLNISQAKLTAVRIARMDPDRCEQLLEKVHRKL